MQLHEPRGAAGGTEQGCPGSGRDRLQSDGDRGGEQPERRRGELQLQCSS